MSIALNWGRHHDSCPEALVWRESLGPQATQADAWRECQRGDWLLWQFRRLPALTREETRPAMRRAIDRIVARAIRQGQRALRGVRAPWATAWRRWARAWLNGTDRTAAAAEAARDAARAAWAPWTAAEAVSAVAWVAVSAAEDAADEAAEDAADEAAAAAAWVAVLAAEAAAEAPEAKAAAVAATAGTAAEAPEAKAESKELLLQARDIRAEISEWPEESG